MAHEERAHQAKQITRWATVRFRLPGFHCWPDAPEYRAYLRERHRHLFHVEVALEVRHNERDVEFHDLLSQCRAWFRFLRVETAHDADSDFGAQSCETLSDRLANEITRRYPMRRVKVSVFEDGETGGTVEIQSSNAS